MFHLIKLGCTFALVYLLFIISGNSEIILKSNTVSIIFDESTKTLTVNCDSGILDTNITDIPLKGRHVEKFENENCALLNSLQRIYSNWNITGTKILALSRISKFPIILRKEHFDNEVILGAEELYLNYSYIIRIEDFTFHKFRNLKKLDLSGNSLEELPRHFSIPSLVELYLGSNKLHFLDEIQFKDFVQLEKIDLRISYSLVLSFSDKLFYPLLKLKTAILSEVTYINIPKRLFANNKNLIEVYIEKGFLMKVDKDAFLGLTELEKLSLKNNYLTTLPADLFVDLTNLKELDLSKNRIEHLPENLFQNLRSLRVLYFNENKLSNWPKSLSRNLPNLVTLSLTHNNITKIFDDTFDGMVKIDKLILNNNNIFSIGNQAFSRLKTLSTLELAYNNLSYSTETSSFINGLNRVECLNLDGNHFTSIPKDIASNVRITLSLMHNEISFIEVEHLLPITYINLDGNDITIIKFQETEPKPALNYSVIYPGHTLRCDCGAYNIIRYLDYKYSNQISGGVHFGNILCAKPDELSGKWPGDINSNDFTCDSSDVYTCPVECDCKLSPKRGALIIDCRSKHLKNLPSMQPFTGQIYRNKNAGVRFDVEKVDIHLENNSLTSFSSVHLNFNNVSGLFLSNNNLSVIQWLPRDFEVLKLDRNKLTTLKEGITLIIKNTRKLKQMALSGNLWECDCKWVSFITEIKAKVQILDYDQILCSDGRYLKDLPFCREEEDMFDDYYLANEGYK